MSEKILSYWLKKVCPKLEHPKLIKSYEYLYLLTNTVDKAKLVRFIWPKIAKYIEKPTLDLARDPKNYNTFKLNQVELKH